MREKLKIGLVAAALLATTAGAVALLGKAGPVVPAGAHRRIRISVGEHQVGVAYEASERKRITYKLKVHSDAYDVLLPVAGQCFVALDVTVPAAHPQLQKVAVKERLGTHEPLDLPAGALFGFKDLPSTADKDQRAVIFAELPCRDLSKSDEELVEATRPR